MALSSTANAQVSNPVPTPAATFPTFIIVGNGVVCSKAPCRSFAAIDQDGELIDVANVILPAGTSAEMSAALNNGGLLIRGVLEEGSWEPDGPGNTLTVNQVEESAETYSALGFSNGGIACTTTPCPSVSAVSLRGLSQHLSNVDFPLLNPSIEDLAHIAHDLFAGEIVVHGFLLPHKLVIGTYPKLLVTKIAGETKHVSLKYSNTVCVTAAPCPSFVVTDASGNHTNVTDVNLSALNLSTAGKNVFFKNVEGGIKVKGYIGSYQEPFVGKHTVLLVTFDP
jgi:hypothetical protein